MTREGFMKNVIFTAIALALLVGCERSEANSSSANSPIILDCSGEKEIRTFKSGELVKELVKTSYLIKINNEDSQKSLYYYNASEQRLEPSECRKHTKCQVVVNSDLIEESGTTINNDNRVTWAVLTKINRRTGRMTIEHFNPWGYHFLTFEGICKRSILPTVQPLKF